MNEKYFALLFIYSLDFILLARKKNINTKCTEIVLFTYITSRLRPKKYEARRWRLNNFSRIFMKITTEAFKSFWSYLLSTVLRRIILFQRSSKVFKSNIGKQNNFILQYITVHFVLILASKMSSREYIKSSAKNILIHYFFGVIILYYLWSTVLR